MEKRIPTCFTKQKVYLLIVDIQWFAHNTVEKRRCGFYRNSKVGDLTYLTFTYTQAPILMEDLAFKKRNKERVIKGAVRQLGGYRQILFSFF